MTVPNTFANTSVGTSIPLEELDENFAALGNSSNSDFLQAGGGAVARTVQSKLRDTYSIKDFGAVGDGVTDDRPAFVAANNTGGYIYIPPPAVSYKVSSPINMNNCGISPNPMIPWASLTYDGNITWDSNSLGPWASSNPIQRLSGRTFFGAASSQSTGSKYRGTPPIGTFLTTQMGAFWMERGATTLSVSGYGEFGGTFAVRTSDKAKSGYDGGASIGILGIVENDDSSANSTIGWAGYFEANRNTNNKTVYGLEISLKNKGNNRTPTPYSRDGWGTIGIWMPAGGDSSYNGVNANPCAAAIMIGRGDDDGNTYLPMSWNKGIVFNSDAITGTDGSTGTGIAIDMAKGHVIRWAVSSGSNGASILSTVTDSTKSQALVFADNQVQFLTNGSGYSLLVTTNTGTANQIRLISEGAGTSPIIQAGGTDTDIDLRLIPKGTGAIRFGTHTATADTAISGYITIKDASGTTRKLAVIA